MDHSAPSLWRRNVDTPRWPSHEESMPRDDDRRELATKRRSSGRRDTSYVEAMTAFLQERKRRGLPTPEDDPVAALVGQLHRTYSTLSPELSSIGVPSEIGTRSGNEGQHHRWLRGLLHVTANHVGFVEPFTFRGCRPDVLLLHPRFRCLLVGDAKDSRHQRALDSEGAVGRYVDSVERCIKEGDVHAAVIAVVTDNMKAALEWFGGRGLAWLVRSRGLQQIPATTTAMVAGDGVTWVVTTGVRLPPKGASSTPRRSGTSSL
jgi:hypothetical protein